MAVAPMRAAQQVLGQAGAFGADVFRWLESLRRQSNDNVFPIGTILSAKLSSSDISTYFSGTGLGNAGDRWAGWAICNGNNGTPNLDGKFPRFEVSQSGGTGGSDSSAHTHAIDHDHGSFTSGTESAHTHTTPDHQHVLPIGFDSTNIFGHANGSGNPIYGSETEGSVSRFALAHGGLTSATVRRGFTKEDGSGTSGAGSAHSHSVDVPALTGTSGAASATDNKPAYYEVVPCMRIS